MFEPKRIWIGLTIGIGFVYSYYLLTSVLLSSSVRSVSSPRPLPPSRTIPYALVEMTGGDRPFKIATNNGQKPYSNGDAAKATVINHLQLVDACKADPSLIVVDVGASFGEFGLYAAACGCQVYIFEVQPGMIDYIRTSIAFNNFSTSRVHIIHKAVHNLPSYSEIVLNMQGALTTTTNGTLRVSTLRLDDVKWPLKSTILMLKIDAEGFELDVLRSAEKLFREKRVHHLIFEYTAWWTDRTPQKDLIPFVEKTLNAKKFFALDRRSNAVYGPLDRAALDQFHEDHVRRHLQTDIYATFVESKGNSTLKVEPYNTGSSFA